MATPVYNAAGNVVETDNNSTATISSFSAAAGSNRFLEVWVGVGAGSPPDISTVTWGGQSLTQRGTTLTGATNWKLSKWYLKEADFPGSATGDIVATAAAAADEFVVMALVCEDVDQTSPYRNASQTTGDDGASTSPSISVTSNADDLVTAGVWCAYNAPAITAISNSAGTERTDTGAVAGGYEIGSVATVAGAATAVVTWSVSTGSGSLLTSLQMADSLQGATASDVLLGQIIL